jgi:branched-chain amino acid aminotransferase
MFLDAATHTKVEETGGANFLFVTKDNKVVTPKSDSILPSITRRSLMVVATEYLGLSVRSAKSIFPKSAISPNAAFAERRPSSPPSA